MVAEKYLHPDSMTIMMVADTSSLEDDLSEFGEMTYMELKDPIEE
jgi:hypothetical protein